MVARLAFIISRVVRVTDGVGGGMVGRVGEGGYRSKGSIVLCSLWNGERGIERRVWGIVCVCISGWEQGFDGVRGHEGVYT